MKTNKIKKMVSAMLSVLMLQMVNTDCILSLAVDLNQNTSKTENTELLKVPELSDSALSLDVLPDRLLNELQVEFQNSVKLDKSTYADLYSIGTINNDGTKSLLTFNSPVKYLDNETNNIHFIDNDFVSAVGDEDIAFESCGNSYNARFSADISDGVLFSESGFTINMKPVDAVENNEPQIINNELIYNNAFDDKTDISYALENSGIKESIIVDEPTGCSTYSFTISADGLVPDTESGKSITLLDETNGEPVFVIQPIYIIDSYIGEYIDGEEHITYDNYYDIELQDDGTYLLQMNLDEEFLNAESTIYPCIIDPSIWAVDLYSNSSSYVQQSGGYGYVNNELSVGSFNGSGEHISYVKANDVDKFRWIEPNRLISAEFRVKAASTGYTNACTINCYDSMVNIPVTSVQYSQLASSLGELQSSTTFTTLGTTYSFNVTNLFKQWIRYELGEGGKDPSYGFILKGATGASTPGRIFSSTSSPDSCFYLTYEEGEEIDDGFYNIRNVSTGKYLRYNNGGQLTLSSSPSTDACKWQAILQKNEDRSLTYGVYMLSPYNDLNVYMKGMATNDAVTTNSSGNTFRIIRNADGTFRIMPAGESYARVSNAIGANSNYASIQEYSNISSMKWTFEPVVNRFFSEYNPEKFNESSVKQRLNCYGYVMGHILHYSETGNLLLPYKQQPGDFAYSSKFNLIKDSSIYPDVYLDNMEFNLKLDAARLGYSVTEYVPNGNTVEQFGANSRLIAVTVRCYNPFSYHFYMQHNDGTWSHKKGENEVTDKVYLRNDPIPKYLNNQNIIEYAESNTYLSGHVRFFEITRPAISDYSHGKVDIQGGIQAEIYYKDMAGENMFTSSNIVIGEQEACIDKHNDVDFYVFNPTITRNYTIQTTSFKTSDNGAISDIDADDLDCEIYDKNGNLVYTDKNTGQINKVFVLNSGQNYFIKIYNHSKNPCNYTLTLS